MNSFLNEMKDTYNEEKIKMQTWDKTKSEMIETPKKMIDFFNELDQLCQKYNLSIAHEDSQGAFLIENYNKFNIDWIKSASKCYETEEEKYLKNLF